jgi:hypothetical protein
MTDIFQEVEEDIRRERMARLWQRYGIYVILTAVLIVLVTAGYRGYEAWTTSRERAAGDRFTEVLQTAQEGLPSTAAEELLAYAGQAPSGYAMLARFRAATAYEQAGEPQEAIALLSALAEDAPGDLYRDLARVRLAQLHLDAGDPAGAVEAVASLAEESSSPFHRSAQEMMGLAAYARDDLDEARRWFTALEEGADTPAALRQRAGLMLALIEQTTGQAATGNGARETN